MQVSSDFLEIIIDNNRTSAFFMLGNRIIGHTDSNNKVDLKNLDKIAKELKVKVNPLKTAISEYVNMGLITKTPVSGVYSVNPDYVRYDEE